MTTAMGEIRCLGSPRSSLLQCGGDTGGRALAANLQCLRCAVVIYSCRVHSLSGHVVGGVLYTCSDTFLQKIF